MTTSGWEPTVAITVAHATASASIAALDQQQQIATAVLQMPLSTTMEHAHAMKDTQVKIVPSGLESATLFVMAATDQLTPTATTVLRTQPRTNTEIVIVIGSGRELAVTSSYTRETVTPSAIRVADVQAQELVTVIYVMSMHS